MQSETVGTAQFQNFNSISMIQPQKFRLYKAKNIRLQNYNLWQQNIIYRWNLKNQWPFSMFSINNNNNSTNNTYIYILP